MKRRGFLVGVVLALTASNAGWALWLIAPLKPGALKQPDRVFTVQVEPMRDGIKRFTITAKGLKYKLLDTTNAALQVVHNRETLAFTQVQPSWDKGTVTFSFDVSQAAIAESQFDIRDPGSRGGTSWRIALKDFEQPSK